MQTSCRVNDDDVGIVSYSTLYRVVCYRGWGATHLLLHHRYTHAFAPNAQLLHGSGTEGVGCTQIDFLACLLELPGEFADGRRLAYPVHTNHQNHVGFVVFG